MSKRSRDDLEQARARWWATVSTGDLEGYLSLFADDAVWVTPELDEIVGREAIREWLAPVFAQFDYELTITVADVRVAGDLGIERARFLSRMTPKVRSVRPEPALAGGEALGGTEGVGDLFDADRAAEGVGGVPAGSAAAGIGGALEGAGDRVEGAADRGAPEGDDGALQFEGEAAPAVEDTAGVVEGVAGDAEGGDSVVDAAPDEDRRPGTTHEHEHEHEHEGEGEGEREHEHEGEVGAVTEPEPLVSGEPWGDTAPASGGVAEPVGSADIGGPAASTEAEPGRDVSGGDEGRDGGEGAGGDEGAGELAGAGDEPGPRGAMADDGMGTETFLERGTARQEVDGPGVDIEPGAAAGRGSAAGAEAGQIYAAVDEAVTDGVPDTEAHAGDESSPLPLGPEEGDHEPHEGRYLMYWRWHGDAGWLVQRYADVTGVG